MEINTDRTGSCKSNYHTITTTTSPERNNTIVQCRLSREAGLVVSVASFFQAQWNRCDQHNHQAKKYLRKDIIHGANVKINVIAFFVFLEKSQYKVCFKRIREREEGKRKVRNFHLQCNF